MFYDLFFACVSIHLYFRHNILLLHIISSCQMFKTNSSVSSLFNTLLHLQVDVWQQLFCGKKAFCNFSQTVVLWFCTSSVSGQFSVLFVITFVIPDCAIPTNSLQLPKASGDTQLAFTQEKLKSSVDLLFSNRNLINCLNANIIDCSLFLSAPLLEFMSSCSVLLQTLDVHFILSTLVLFLLC